MSRRQPNILFIVLDTLRRDRLGIYGHAQPTSPAFDDFASQGVRFDRAIAPAQWTIPSHGSMFTGLYPTSHQLTQANSVLSGEFPTLAEVLHSGGYHTVGFCNNPLVGALDHGLQRGFTEFYNYGSAVPQRPNEVQRNALYRAFMQRFRPFARRVGNQFARHDGLFRAALHPFWVPIWTKYINFKGNTTASISDLIDYWKTYQAGGQQQPIFAFLNLMQSHLPFQPPQQYLDRVAPELKNDRRAYRYMGQFNTDGAAWASPPERPLEDWQTHTLQAFYDAEIAFQDEHLGRLLAYLETSGQLDNTFVLIAADHGEGLGDHDLFGHGFKVHQELVHVPLIMRGADRVPQSGFVKQNLSTRRIFHTLLDIAQIQPPLASDDPNGQISHLSLLNALRGEDSEDDVAFSEAIPPSTFLHVLEHRNPVAIERMRLQLTRRAIYDGEHKLVMAGDQVEALYHVEHDPAELLNRIDSDGSLVKQLSHKLRVFITEHMKNSAINAGEGEVSEEVMEQLRALGYVD